MWPNNWCTTLNIWCSSCYSFITWSWWRAELTQACSSAAHMHWLISNPAKHIKSETWYPCSNQLAQGQKQGCISAVETQTPTQGIRTEWHEINGEPCKLHYPFPVQSCQRQSRPEFNQSLIWHGMIGTLSPRLKQTFCIDHDVDDTRQWSWRGCISTWSITAADLSVEPNVPVNHNMFQTTASPSCLHPINNITNVYQVVLQSHLFNVIHMNYKHEILCKQNSPPSILHYHDLCHNPWHPLDPCFKGSEVSHYRASNARTFPLHDAIKYASKISNQIRGIIIIIISLTSIFFQDQSRAWTAASQQH